MAVVVLRPEDEPTYPEYQQLATAARGQARINWTVDPANMWPEDGALARRGSDWAQAVLGFAYGRQRITRWHQELLLLADEHDVCPPLPEHVVAARAAAQQKQAEQNRARAERREALDAEWAALRAALPVKVVVVHNYKSARHCENGFEQGADHILVCDHFQHGRLARLAEQAFCQTRSREKDLYFPYGTQLDQGGVGGDRLPTCKACIRAVCKITNLQAPTLLGMPHANGSGFIPNKVWKAETPQGRRWPK